MRPHPNIVRFYDAWMEPAAKEKGAEHCFIWLEKCGETVVQRVRCGGDPFTEPELVELLRQVTPNAHVESVSEQQLPQKTHAWMRPGCWTLLDRAYGCSVQPSYAPGG